MPTTTKQIMEFVKNMLDLAADEDWTVMDIYEYWETKEKEVSNIIEVEKPKPKTKKASSPKDPNKPKRARSAYLFYSQDVRPVVKEEMSDATSQEVTKEIASRWKELKESKNKWDKQNVIKYTNMAEEDKKRAEKELATYVAPSDDELEAIKPKRGRKPSTEKKDAKPKKGRTAYVFFCAENREEVKAENPDATGREITKILSGMWKDIKEDEDEVQKYKDMASKDKKRAEKELAAYPSDDDKDYQEPKAKKPKNTNTVGFKKFAKANKQDYKDENPDMKAADITKLMKEDWDELDQKEQEAWANEEQE